MGAGPQSFVYSTPPWVGWMVLAGAVVAAVGLAVPLLVIARRSRRLPKLLTALLLLLCVPVISSRWPTHTLTWSPLPDPYAFLGSAALLLAAAVAWFGFDLRRRRRLVAAAASYVPSAVGLGWITLMWAFSTGVGSWLPAIQMATGPALSVILLGHEAQARVRAALDRKRRTDGADPCPACGYDLRATPGRCPECGCEPQPVSAGSGGGG